MSDGWITAADTAAQLAVAVPDRGGGQAPGSADGDRPLVEVPPVIPEEVTLPHFWMSKFGVEPFLVR